MGKLCGQTETKFTLHETQVLLFCVFGVGAGEKTGGKKFGERGGVQMLLCCGGSENCHFSSEPIQLQKDKSMVSHNILKSLGIENIGAQCCSGTYNSSIILLQWWCYGPVNYFSSMVALQTCQLFSLAPPPCCPPMKRNLLSSQILVQFVFLKVQNYKMSIVLHVCSVHTEGTYMYICLVLLFYNLFQTKNVSTH